MKPLKKKTKILLIVVAVVVLVLLALVIFLAPELIQPFLWTLLVLGLGFFGLEYWARRKKKKQQKAFDEKVSAKEGIEDRKREWAKWIEELDRQGIDRYELPFYMIVGEPQSGKSILLQNSDLYFPFGQDRLSGVGGTRGCDWWFTDEAVMLDIAGRMFTHEGGVADKLEWEAFLDLLHGFRPLCPANGVLLVIPCDALLEDGPELCAEKANKIQSALLTLSQRLQAKLPIYLVLTKGDKIFGFAESVHRLDAEERHQMFGWSRADAKSDEDNFALDEAKSGFAMLVDRARLLRERMIASARLPEALPEIDRLYAFPDELSGMYGALEIYLKRIFTESSLVESMSFRGIYLTSGLQSGVPIAKVCADLIGDDRDSDARGLESLFSHQRAYFIKELVRERVFAERGLVRPTEGRVASAKRNAMIGYGAAGLLAASALVGSVVHLMSDRGDDAQETFQTALASARAAVGRTELPDLLRDLDVVDQAVRADRDLMREVFKSTRDQFEGLYSKICSRSLVPAVRRRLEERLLEDAQNEPQTYDQFASMLQTAIPLFDSLDFGKGKNLELAKNYLGNEWVTRVEDADGAAVEFSVSDALAKHDGSGSGLISPVGTRERLDPLAKRLVDLLDRSIDPATPWMMRGHLGYLAAWRGAEQAQGAMTTAAKRLTDDLLVHCDVFANSLTAIEEMSRSPLIEGGVVTNSGYTSEWRTIDSSWLRLNEFLKPGSNAKWSRLALLDAFAGPKFVQYSTKERLPTIDPGGLLGLYANRLQQDAMGKKLAKINISELTGDLNAWIGGEDYQACLAAPKSDWSLRSIGTALGDNVEGFGALYSAKVQVMAKQVANRYPNWRSAQDAFYAADAGDMPLAHQLDQSLLRAMAQLRRDFGNHRLRTKDAPDHLAAMMAEHLRAVDGAWASRSAWGDEIDWSVPSTLSVLALDVAAGAQVTGLADGLRFRYLGEHQSRLFRFWNELPRGSKETLEIVGQLNTHLGKIAELESLGGTQVRFEDVGYVRWLGKVDLMVAERLDQHLDAAKAFWRPSTAAWGDLAQALAGVKKALDTNEIRRKIQDSRSGLETVSPSAPEMRPSQPVSSTARLPNSTASIAQLRGFDVPSDRDVLDHPTAGFLRIKLGEIETLLRDGSKGDRALARLASGWAAPVTRDPDVVMTTVDHYLEPLHDVLQRRTIEKVRSRYLGEISEAMSDTRGQQLMTALYATTPEEIEGVDDRDVVEALGLLLDPDGTLDRMRAKFQMDPGAGEEPEPNLRPAAGWEPPAAREAAWWELERLLVGLQRFLIREKGDRVANAAFRVRFSCPSRGGPVWDIETTKKQFFYYSTSSRGSASGFAKFTNRGWDKLRKPLVWEFSKRQEPRLWFNWTGSIRMDKTFRFPENKKDDDISFLRKGSLAPFLLAWSGVEDEGGWVVVLEPDGTDEEAKIRLSFQAPEGDDSALVLPKRPQPRPDSL